MGRGNNGPPAQKRFAWTGSLETDAITIVDNETYAIKDLPLRDDRGVIQFTVSVTSLNPRQSTTGHSHGAYDEVYTFVEGQGLMNVDGNPFFVKPGDHIFIGKGKWHQVTNTESKDNLIFLCYYPGEIKRDHLK